MTPRFNKVYVILPYDGATGGIELGHQLVDYINNHGGDAYVLYQENDQIVKTDKVTPAYTDYNIKVACEIDDEAGNMLVLPEVYFDWMYRYKYIKLGFWWMSVDNHFKNCHWLDCFRFHTNWRHRIIRTYQNFRKGVRNTLADMRRDHDRIYHFYQSAYAQNFLYNSGIGRVIPLGDYINPATYTPGETASAPAKREDLILYNPLKGLRFTRRLIKANPDIEFIALRDLSRRQLNEYMRRAKLYIDFGNFPGKDRLPREAVMNGMCIITGTEGASKYYEDVAIDSDYKFAVKRRNIPAISRKIREVLENFDTHTSRFDNYRERIRREKAEFATQINNFFFVGDPS